MGQLGFFVEKQRDDGNGGQKTKGKFGSSEGRTWGKLRGEFAIFLEGI